MKPVSAEMKGHCKVLGIITGLQSLPGRIELGVKERLCNGNDGEAAAFRGCQTSIAENLEEQIRSSFGKNDIL